MSRDICRATSAETWTEPPFPAMEPNFNFALEAKLCAFGFVGLGL